jgi:DNA repair protein RadD
VILRDYQQRTLDQLYAWFEAGNKGNPCIVMPTGSGKSHIVAALCRDAIQNWPETVVLMLTHVKELIEQNAEKMQQYWPDAPLGIYSAGMRQKKLGNPITFGGIQSLREKAKDIGHVDLVIIDEAHLVNHKNAGGYRKLVRDLKQINPELRVVGLTATPYRLGHGMITDEPAIFSDLIEPIGIEELIAKQFLMPLRSKHTKVKLDTTGVHKKGGEFIESELQAAVDTDDQNNRVVAETIALAGDRRAWLFFCTGVNHAKRVAQVLNSNGILTGCILGTTPKKDRELMLADFKSGNLRAITNANVLTTGFDYPDIDLIAMMRPTLSPGLYVQMAGRGMRPKSHTDHCLVLDFAGIVATHGPITAVQPPRKAGEGNGVAPVKVCEKCNELCHPSAVVCPSCGHPFPLPPAPKLKLRNDDIMGLSGVDMDVTAWKWRKHRSQTSGKEMLSCTYYGALSDKPVTEYLPVMHEGYAGDKAGQQLFTMARNSGVVLSSWDTPPFVGEDELESWSEIMNNAKPPAIIKYKMDGKFYRVIERKWE